MNKRLILVFFLLSTCLFAQRIEISDKGKQGLQLEKHQVNFNLLSPGIKYEIGLFRNVTAAASLGLGLATPEEFYSLAPTLNAKAKFYHNIDRRIAMGKNISGNSGDFFAFSFNNYFTKWQIAGNLEDVERDLISFGLVYGIQRTYENGISFEIEAGGGS
ncbi:MAG: hypothetical protein AB8B59_10940 [Maribacter sp.]